MGIRSGETPQQTLSRVLIDTGIDTIPEKKPNPEKSGINYGIHHGGNPKYEVKPYFPTNRDLVEGMDILSAAARVFEAKGILEYVIGEDVPPENKRHPLVSAIVTLKDRITNLYANINPKSSPALKEANAQANRWALIH